MPKLLKHRLLEKGWSHEEAEKAHNILYSKEKQEKHVHYKHFSSPFVYWTILVVGVLGNFFASIALFPLFLFFPYYYLYIFIILLGLCFGIFFHIIIKDIEHVDYKHHLIGSIAVPVIAIPNIFLITVIANMINPEHLKTIFGLSTDIIQQNPYTVAAVYAIFFVLPYLVYKADDMSGGKVLGFFKRFKR